VKEFVIYTAARLGLFVLTYAVLAGLWLLVMGQQNALIWPFVIAIVISSLLSLKFLAPQREAFARRVDERAHRATARFEEIRSREDAD
jgi:hypothetical protein